MRQHERMVYLVIRTNNQTAYKKTMLLRNGANIEIPLYRYQPESRALSCRRLYLQIGQIAPELVSHEFTGLSFQRVRYIGRVDQRSVYLAEFTGWPVPIDGHYCYFFEEDFNLYGLENGSGQVLRLVNENDRRRSGKNVELLRDHF